MNNNTGRTTMSKRMCKKVKQKTQEYVDGMQKLGTPVSKTEARRIITRRLGFKRPEEIRATDSSFREGVRGTNPKYNHG